MICPQCKAEMLQTASHQWECRECGRGATETGFPPSGQVVFGLTNSKIVPKALIPGSPFYDAVNDLDMSGLEEGEK